MKYFAKYFRAKKFMKFYITSSALCTLKPKKPKNLKKIQKLRFFQP